MDAEFWHERWGSGRTAWDQRDTHPLLVEHWPEHVDPGGGAVFVPLCGSSIDMAWLAAQGHRVVGNDLSAIGIESFLADQGVEAAISAVDGFTVYRAGPCELWCGDFFEMPPSALDGVIAVYDRASLVALPPEMRRRYADRMTALVPEDAVIVLLSFEYDEDEMGGPPFSVGRDEIVDLYEPAWEATEVVRHDVLERSDDLRARGLTALMETMTVLRRPA